MTVQAKERNAESGEVKGNDVHINNNSKEEERKETHSNQERELRWVEKLRQKQHK